MSGSPPLHLSDSHVHLTAEAFAPDRAEMIARARAAGVATLVDVHTILDRQAWALGRALAKNDNRVFLTLGVHPHEAKDFDDRARAELEEALQEERKVVALGEIGLDYHYMNSPAETQRDVFARCLDLALARQLPVSIHCRDAFADVYALTQDRQIFSTVGGVMHCFTGGPAEAERFLDAGAHLSFSGILTFKKAAEIRQAARITPLDRLLVETDAPYLAPVPHRGKRNEPAYVPHVAAALAEIKGITPQELATLTTENLPQVMRTRPTTDS